MSATLENANATDPRIGQAGPPSEGLRKDASSEGLRPPYLKNYQMPTEPLIVLPAFLSRADTTPHAHRPRDPDNVVDHNGVPIAEPSADTSALAFETDPNLAFEKWDEYWRKVHGMRFTYEEGPDDRSMAVMLRYDQVHRIPGGPTSQFPPPYYAPVDQSGQLHENVIGRIAPYQRPLYDGFAYMAFRSVEDLALSFGHGKFPAKIVPEERVMFRSVPHLITREHILIASTRHREPVSLVKVHKRRADLDRADFQGRWLEDHGKTVLSNPATHAYVTRYAQLHNIGPKKEGDLFWHPVGSRWDGISILSFDCMADCEDFLMSDEHRQIADEEARLTDESGSEFWTGINYHIINRIYPQLATIR